MCEGTQAFAGYDRLPGLRWFEAGVFYRGGIFHGRVIKNGFFRLLRERVQVTPHFVHERGAFGYEDDRTPEDPLHFKRKQGGGGKRKRLETAYPSLRECFHNRRYQGI